MERPSRSGKDQKKKRTDLFRRISNRLKIKKLQEKNKRGRVTKKKTGLSNIPVQERSADVNKKSRGLSNLGSDYRKQEEKLSKKATEKSARINKARYPEMGTYKNKDGKSVADEKKKSKSNLKAGKYFSYKGKRYKAGSIGARKVENILRARKRAQEMYKKNKANK